MLSRDAQWGPFDERLGQVINALEYPQLKFLVGAKGSVRYLQVMAHGVCNDTGKPLTWKGRKWILSSHMTNSEIVQTALKAVLTALEHEAREKFTYKGVRVFDPHIDVDEVAAIGGLKQTVRS